MIKISGTVTKTRIYYIFIMRTFENPSQPPITIFFKRAWWW